MVHTLTYSYSCSPEGPHHVEICLTQLQPPANRVKASFYCAFSADRPAQNRLIPSGDALFSLTRMLSLPAPLPRQRVLDGMTQRLEIQCGTQRGFYEWWGELPEALVTLRPLINALETLLQQHLPKATARRNLRLEGAYLKAQ